MERFKGHEDSETLICDGTMPQIFNKANLKLKAIAVSGEEDGKALEKLSGSVLGHGNSTERDTLAVRFKVNVTPRKRGNPTGPDLTIDTLGEIDKPGFVLTRRIVLVIANGQFDMRGITTPLLIKHKASMRDLFVPELGLNWDTPLPEEHEDLDYLHQGGSGDWTVRVQEMYQTIRKSQEVLVGCFL